MWITRWLPASPARGCHKLLTKLSWLARGGVYFIRAFPTEIEIHLNGLQTCRTSSAPAGIVVYMLNKMGEFLLYLARSDLFSKFPAIKCLEKSRNVQQCLLPRPELQSHHAAHCVEAGGEVCGAVAEPRQQGPDLVFNVLKCFRANLLVYLHQPLMHEH